MNLYDYSSMFQPSLSSQIPQSIHHHTTGDYNNPIRLEVANHGPDIEAKTSKTTVQEMVASKSHSEAEIRRRERINNHLTKLRSLLPNTAKTDKATLLAEVIQHIKKLKHQTSMMDKQSSVPSETDELIIDNTFDEEGRIVIKASLCCEDRFMKDLVKTLKMLRLRTLKAEITTLGRRVKNVLFVTNEDRDLSTRDDKQMANHSLNVIEETLKALMEKTDYGDDSSFVSIKRQRTNKCSYCH